MHFSQKPGIDQQEKGQALDQLCRWPEPDVKFLSHHPEQDY
jgi:hypothetical protein